MRKPTASFLLILSPCHPLSAATDVPTVQTPLADMTVPLNTGIPAPNFTTAFSVSGVGNTFVQVRMTYGPTNMPGIINIGMAPAAAVQTISLSAPASNPAQAT